jgi:Mrp family chromosome partitioning ATPase
MSRIFDALQKSEAERSGIDTTDLAAAELLQVAEREAAAEHESAVQYADVPADVGRGSSPLVEPDCELQPLQPESGKDSIKLEPSKLEIDDKQRDELMKFVQNVFLMPGREAPGTVLIAGTEPGNGSSWICCRVADILACQVKGPICVVDSNLRSPGLHQMFGVDNHHGLSDALEATESIRSFVLPLGRSNLWLLSCGANAAERRSLLSSDRMKLRLSELRQYFKYVLIDSPALSLGNEGIVLGRAAEGVVLVLKANSSRRDAARKAVQDLQNAGVRILGAVLNQRTFPIPESIYRKL